MEWAFESKFNRHSLLSPSTFIPTFPLDALHFVEFSILYPWNKPGIKQDLMRKEVWRTCAQQSIKRILLYIVKSILYEFEVQQGKKKKQLIGCLS